MDKLAPSTRERWVEKESEEVQPASDGGKHLTDAETASTPATHQSVSLQAALKGSFGRFLPASVIASFLVGLPLRLPGDVVGVLALVGVAMAAGYMLALSALRTFLRSDASVDGRKSVIAGIVAPFALFSVAVVVGGANPWQLLLYSILTGLGTGVLMFFPWLRSSDDAGEGAEAESIERVEGSAL